MSRYLLFFAVAIGGCAIDLATKSWIFGRLGYPDVTGTRPAQIWLWQDVFSLTTSLNEGALFGVGQGLVVVFASLSVAAAFFILYWLFYVGAARDRVLTFTLALIMAGIFGNLYDRLGIPDLHWLKDGSRVYAVRDWLDFQVNGHHWPVFNIADSMLVCGAALLFLHVAMLKRVPNSG